MLHSPNPLVNNRKRLARKYMPHGKADIFHRSRASRQRVLEPSRPLRRVELVVVARDDQNIRVAVLVLILIPVARDAAAYRYHSAYHAWMSKSEAVVQRHRL